MWDSLRDDLTVIKIWGLLKQEGKPELPVQRNQEDTPHPPQHVEAKDDCRADIVEQKGDTSPIFLLNSRVQDNTWHTW